MTSPEARRREALVRIGRTAPRRARPDWLLDLGRLGVGVLLVGCGVVAIGVVAIALAGVR